MRPSLKQLTLAVVCLLTVATLPAQEDSRPADASAVEAVTSLASDSGDSFRRQRVWAVDATIEALPEAFRNDSAHQQLIKELDKVRYRQRGQTPDSRRELVLKVGRQVADWIQSNTPEDQRLPLANLAAELFADVEQDPGTPVWHSRAIEELQQLEKRLAVEFPSQIELAATIGLKLLSLQSIPQPDQYAEADWTKASDATKDFLRKYPQTTAAVRAGILMGAAYERAMPAPDQPLRYRPTEFPETAEYWYSTAISHGPDTLLGKLARGCVTRQHLVGQILQVSGNSLDGKPLSLESLRGEPTVVVFFRANKGSWHLQPNKTPWYPSPKIDSWGQFATPLEFAVATRDRGCQLLGVHCHNPTLPQADVEALPKFATPEVFQKNDFFPVIDDSADADSSDSVRFGITWFPRLFVLVDETGKVVRTQLSEIKDLDEFLGLPKPTQPAAAPPAETNADQSTAATDGESKSTPPATHTETKLFLQVRPSLCRAIDRLPEAFRTDPAHQQLMEDLEYVRRQHVSGNFDDRASHFSKTTREVLDTIHGETPQNQHQPLTDLAAQLLAEIHHENDNTSKWSSWALDELVKLEQRLAKEFPNQLELAATVGLERIKIQVIPKPGGSVDDYWGKAPAGLHAFLEKYPHSAAAAQAAFLLANAYEVAQNSPAGLPLPAEGQFREPTHRWYHLAVEQSPDSLWGKLARGCLNRLDLVGQTLHVSGKSLDGKPLSLEQFRGKPTVVVFYRPGKSSWGAAENPGDFADAVRQRGVQVLSVLCHSPTASPDEIDKFLTPATPEDAPHSLAIVDTDDVDTSYSVRFGLTALRLFVLVDETGKVVRTATTEIKNLDEFLGLPIDPPTTDAALPATTAQAQTPATALDPFAPSQPPTPAANSPLMMKIFHLQNGVAADYSKLLQDIFTGTKLTADPRTNAILAAGEERELQKIEALLRALDESKTKPAAPDGSATATEIPKSKRRSLAFTATWCGPCQKILPILRSIAEQGAPIQFVDVDREPELAKRHQVTSIPAVIVEEDGREVERLVGIASRLQLEKLILGRVVTSPDAPAPARSVATDTSDDPFAAPQGFSVPLPTPSRSQPPGLLALESRAAELAHKVRELSKTHGSAHPELIAARQQLEQTLTEALELKFRSEQRQVATLEQRLDRLKSQLDQRKAVRHEIVERRLRELLETPTTRWNTGNSTSDSSSRPSIPPQATEAASTNLQPAVQDQITVDLYATDGIYQNDKLIAAVVAPLNKLSRVVANVRMIPGDSGKFVFAIVHDPSQRMYREAQQTGQESATRQAISAALKAGEINNVRWEGAIDFVPAKDVLPTEREVAPGAAAAPSPITPPTRKPTDSLEASARLTLDLAEAEADIRETEAKLAIQVKLHARGVVAIDEVTGAMQRRDRAVRKRQILLDEYAATVKDLELQLSAASLENDLAELDHRRLIQLVEQKAVPLKEAQDAALRAVRSAHTLERLKNRLEFLKKSGEGSAVKEPSPSKPPADSQASPIEPTPDPQPVKN